MFSPEIKTVLWFLLLMASQGATQTCSRTQCICLPDKNDTNYSSDQQETNVSCSGETEIIPYDLSQNLISLKLSNNKIEKVDTILGHYSELKILILDGNGITTIEPGAFQNNEKLTHLDLSSNALTDLGARVFDGLTSLITLNLSENNIEHIGGEIFGNAMPKLNHLDLSNNRIKTFSSLIFKSGVNQLQTLKLSKNFLENFLEEGLFSKLKHLHYLDLSFNEFQEYSSSNLSINSENLRELNLSGCSLKNLEKANFTGLSGLRKLDLSQNNLNNIPLQSLRVLRGLEELHLGLNYFPVLPPSSFQGLVNLKSLIINGCYRNIPFEISPEAFQDNVRLEMLNITSCPGLKRIQKDTMTALPFLRVLNFHGSQIADISEFAGDWSQTKHVDLTSNPLYCKCWFSMQKYFRGSCWKPISVRGREIDSLKSEELNCKSSHLGPSIGIPMAVLLVILIVFLVYYKFQIKRKRRKRRIIHKDDIRVIPKRVSDPSNYRDVLLPPNTQESSPFPDVKTSNL